MDEQTTVQAPEAYAPPMLAEMGEFNKDTLGWGLGDYDSNSLRMEE